MAIAAIFLFQLLGCHASPVRSPRTSALRLRNQPVTRSDRPSLRQDYLIPSDENGADLAVATYQSFIPTTDERVPLAEPEATDNTGNPDPPVLPNGSDEAEQPARPIDVDIIHSGLHNSDSIETVTQSDVHGLTGAEPTQKLEESSYSQTLPEEQGHLSDNQASHKTIGTSELYHSPNAAAPSDPAELPLTHPLERVPETPSAVPITVADLPLETFLPFSTAALPEKVETGSSPEAPDRPLFISGPEQGNGALPLDLSSFSNDPQQIQVDQIESQPINNSYDLITTGNPIEKDNSSDRPFGSLPKLRELGFPPISNTQDNFGVQVNWAEFR